MTIVKATGTDQIDENSLKNTYRIMYFMDASVSYISFDINWIRIQFKATGRDALHWRIIYGDTVGSWLEYALKSDLDSKVMYKTSSGSTVFNLRVTAASVTFANGVVTMDIPESGAISANAFAIVLSENKTLAICSVTVNKSDKTATINLSNTTYNGTVDVALLYFVVAS